MTREWPRWRRNPPACNGGTARVDHNREDCDGEMAAKMAPALAQQRWVAAATRKCDTATPTRRIDTAAFSVDAGQRAPTAKRRLQRPRAPRRTRAPVAYDEKRGRRIDARAGTAAGRNRSGVIQSLADHEEHDAKIGFVDHSWSSRHAIVSMTPVQLRGQQTVLNHSAGSMSAHAMSQPAELDLLLSLGRCTSIHSFGTCPFFLECAHSFGTCDRHPSKRRESQCPWRARSCVVETDDEAS